MDKNDFFIGWQEKIPSSNRKALKIFLSTTFVVILAVAFLFVLNQKQFLNHKFNLGNIEVIEGTYYSYPVPTFIVDDVNWDKELSKNILLVGYGKFGAEGIMEEIENRLEKLDGKKIKIQGTLIYGDGKTVMELTKKNESVLEIKEDDAVVSVKPKSVNVKLSGEIIDPKCYFGVMKPGEGKIHKSCAIRCISGGIPPVLKVKDQYSSTYHIILGSNGQKINKQLLEYVAEPVMLQGISYEINGWKYIEIDSSKIILL